MDPGAKSGSGPVALCFVDMGWQTHCVTEDKLLLYSMSFLVCEVWTLIVLLTQKVTVSAACRNPRQAQSSAWHTARATEDVAASGVVSFCMGSWLP